MSLDFDFSLMQRRLTSAEFTARIDHPVKGGAEWHPIAAALPWVCMVLGVRGINDKNLDRFGDRLVAWQAVDGPWFKAERIYLTRADLLLYVGLRTNVTDEAPSTFNAKLMRIAIERGDVLCETGRGNPPSISAFERVNALLTAPSLST